MTKSKLQNPNFPGLPDYRARAGKTSSKLQLQNSRTHIFYRLDFGFGIYFGFWILLFGFSFLSFVVFPIVPFAQDTAVDIQNQPIIQQSTESAFVWLEDSLPEGATTTGDWGWAQDIKFSGSSCHTDGIKNGLHLHSFKTTTPVKLENSSVIEQYVYLDPANPPKGIMLKLIPSEGKEIDLYWEAEEEVFVDTIEYMEAWYMGFLPEAGCWQKLVIRMEELEIAPFELAGISFITYDGRTWWDRTSLATPSSSS